MTGIYLPTAVIAELTGHKTFHAILYLHQPRAPLTPTALFTLVSAPRRLPQEEDFNKYFRC